MKSSITMVGQPQTTATLTLAGDTETSNILSVIFGFKKSYSK